MSVSEEFLQVLNGWKDSEGVIVCVHWSSLLEGVTVSFRGYVWEADKNEIQFATDEDKGNVSMTISLEKVEGGTRDKSGVVLTFGSGAILSMGAVPMEERLC